MEAYIYDSETKEVIVIVEGDDNDSIEDSYVTSIYYTEDYGMSYTCAGLIMTDRTPRMRAY